MTRLGDILDLSLLDRMIEERFVVRRVHPTSTLAILNYTERCQYESGAWNEVTRACRGLIYETDSQEVVARPFRKFFNYGQREAPTLDLASPALVTDKLDGSLGILYRRQVGYAIATRGAFESEQAIHATKVWFDRYDSTPVPVGWTLLFEIIYPGNRIVLDYNGRDDLVLLGAVEIASGRSIGPLDARLDGYVGPRAAVFTFGSLAEALAAPPRANAEGLVVHILATDERVKIKQDDYVALHRIVTGLNERTVWEHLKNGKPLAELLEPLPDEFHEWTGGVAARLLATIEGNAAEVERAYSTILASLPAGHTRKDFALQAVKHPMRGALFSRLDGKDYRAGLWEEAKPQAFLTPSGHTFTEDTA